MAQRDDTRYTQREMRRFIMSALAVLKPDALKQLINESDLFPTNQFRMLVDQLLRRYCGHFVNHLINKRNIIRIPADHPKDLLSIMSNFHNLWESWRCDHPWADAQNRPLTYFLDINFQRRLDEAAATF